MSLYSLHCEKYKAGCGATICESASKVVIARGTLPCEVLFVGEAPGPSENVLGLPFVGPAGQLLDKIITAGFDEFGEIVIDEEGEPIYQRPTWAFTNLVGCIPLDEEGKKFHEPDEESIVACQPRLVEFVNTVAKPKLIICVGKLAEKWLIPGGYLHTHRFECKPYFARIDHPAFILRANISQRGMLIQRAIVGVNEAYERHVLGR